jgi:hypothetical protein
MGGGSKGGGGGGSTGAPGYSMSQTSLPPWIQQPAQQAVGMATTLANRPVETNPYEQVSPVTADQTQAYQQIRDLQGSTAGAFNTAMQGYQGLAGQAAPITTGQLNSQTQALMNPYTQSVIDPAVAQMRQGLATNLQTIGKNASDVGAYGGSRQGVTEGVAQGQEAQAEGSLVSQLLNNQYNTAAGQSLDLSKLNLGTGLTALSAMPQLATAQAGEAAKEAGLLQTVGQAQQQYGQSQLDTKAGTWQEAMNFPVQNLDILLSALTGTPYPTTTQGYAPQQQPTSNTGGQILGGLGTAAGIGANVFKMFGI